VALLRSGVYVVKQPGLVDCWPAAAAGGVAAGADIGARVRGEGGI